MERACARPEKVMLGGELPDDLPQDGGGLGTWHWLGFDALKIKNPEVMILGKESSLPFTVCISYIIHPVILLCKEYFYENLSE